MLLTLWNHCCMKTADCSIMGPRWGSSVLFLGIASLVGIPCEAMQGLDLWFPSRELPPPACRRSIEKGTRNPEKEQNLKFEQSRRILQNTLKKPKQLTNWDWAAPSGEEDPACAVSEKPREKSSQKDWSMIFNAVQQAMNLRTDLCPLVTSDFNKGPCQGGAEVLVRWRWQGGKEREAATLRDSAAKRRREWQSQG